LIETKKGKLKILHNGYSYHFHKQDSEKKQWRCVNRKCTGYMYTNFNNDIIKIIDHNNCEKNYNKNEALFIRNNIYKRSRLTNEKPRDIIISELKIAPSVIIKEFPKMNILNDKITEYRKKHNINIISGDIPENVKFTFSNEKFLQFDSGLNDPKRYIIFTTETHLVYLENAINWYCDGTFRSCPKEFTQLYVIMGDIKNITLPLVYIFMKDKSKASYLNVFSYLKSKIKNKKKFNITIDFEMAALCALKEVFGDSDIYGCFFHFTQLLFRSIQRLGLVSEYKKNVYFREIFRMIVSLSFVPLENVKDEFHKLDFYIKSKKDICNIYDFWNNFKNTYGKYIFEKEGDFSIFSVKFWSVYERIKNDLKKTNNVLEGWNRSLNASIYQHHPGIYEIVMELKKQHALVENKINKLFIDMTNENNNNESYDMVLIKKTLTKYNEYYGIGFLKAIAANLKLKEI
ncbi:hypothetical protein DMUE_5702, partial [Dictyocoela muelleri]